MLIIFDLDDTLVDTSGSLTPLLLNRALEKVQAAGLNFPDEDAAKKMLQRLNQRASSAALALEEFLELHNGLAFLEIALKEVYENENIDFGVLPVPGASELLEKLSLHHTLALVSMGKEGRQMKKMEKARINKNLFSKIIILEKGSKISAYKQVAEGFGFGPSEVIVCGDRVDKDLTPAKKLGFRTAHLLWGRGMNDYGTKSDVDYAIVKISELLDLLSTIVQENK